jgi:hypothetical protein
MPYNGLHNQFQPIIGYETNYNPLKGMFYKEIDYIISFNQFIPKL